MEKTNLCAQYAWVFHNLPRTDHCQLFPTKMKFRKWEKAYLNSNGYLVKKKGEYCGIVGKVGRNFTIKEAIYFFIEARERFQREIMEGKCPYFFQDTNN